MRYIDEFRHPQAVAATAAAIRSVITRPWVLMEVCGGQTHSIVKFGLDQLLPDGLELIHGPGCPVCVTPAEKIDMAVELTRRPEVILCSFGDMLRVPGNTSDLLTAKARGGDVRVVYSPLEAVALARANLTRQVVFFAVGFETTAPANALAVKLARRERLKNFSILVSHVLVPPALETILNAPGNRVQGFLAAGHVCAVMGYTQYEAIASRYRVPIAVTGFEPLDILQGIYTCIGQLEAGRCQVENQYERVVRRRGNDAAQRLINDVFEIVDTPWRGIGELPAAGLALRSDYRDFDAEYRFGKLAPQPTEPSECQAGRVLVGDIKPQQCPAYGSRCRPDQPLGAPMVSSEGACAAYFNYRRKDSNDAATVSPAS